MMKNQKKIRLIGISALVALSLTGCVQAPESEAVDGVKVAQSVDAQEEQSQEAPAAAQAQQTVLADFPGHFSCEFTQGENCLTLDAEVTLPEESIKIYTGKVAIEPWEDTKRQELTSKLLEAGLVTEQSPVQVYQDGTEAAPLTALTYSDDELLAQEKQGELSERTDEAAKEQEDAICSVFKDEGFSVELEPEESGGEGWDRSTYRLTQSYEGIPFAGGFPATGTNEIVSTGGSVTMGTEKMISCDVLNFLEVTQPEECQTLATAEEIKASLKAAVEHYEVMFSKGITGIGMDLEYLVESENGEIRIVPVWNITFDVDSYYQYLEKNPEEAESLSMMNLCINAVDGRIAYAL